MSENKEVSDDRPYCLSDSYFYVYVLPLEKNKFYIGRTDKTNPIDRIKEHYKLYTGRSRGSQWTKLYPPIYKWPVKTYRTNDKRLEDTLTKKFMSIYGIRNVRGGTYTTPKLSKHERRTLRKEYCTAENCCFFCTKKGHFARNCPKRFKLRKLPQRIKFRFDFKSKSKTLYKIRRK